MALNAAAGLTVAGGQQSLDAEGLAAVLWQGADEQVSVLDAADQQDGGGVDFGWPGVGAAAPPAVADARGAEEKQQSEGVDDGEGRVGGGGRGQRGDNGKQGGAGGGAGGDGEQISDSGEAPVLQGETERDAGEQQAYRAEG